MKIKLEKIWNLHGGYWRYDFLDFYYLFNSYFPNKKIYKILKEELPVLVQNYPSTQKAIAKSFSKWNKEKYFNEENLIIGNGSSELITVLNRLITKVVIPIPTFNEYVQLPKDKLILFPLKESNNFQLDEEELIKVIRKTKSGYVVINNPNNPTGNITTREQIKKILKTETITVIDESFIDFSKEYSVEDLVPKYKNLVIIKSLTKSMGLGGLRVGYLLTINKKIKEKTKEYLPIWNINSLAERFIELLPDFKKEYDDSIKKTIQARDNLFQKLKEISYLESYKPFANFIFCKTKISSRKLAEILFNKYDILIKSGLNQKSLWSDSYIRIGVRNSKDNERLIKTLRKIHV